MRGSLGLVIGLTVGAGGMYLALRPPWGHGTASAPADAAVAVATPDAGVGAAKKKKPRRPSAPSGPEEYEETEPPPPPLSEADRRLEWRGEDVTLPPRKIDMESSSEARSLDDGEINAAISQADGVRTCVVDGATGTDLRATITVMMIVDGTGRVTKSRVHAPRYLFEKGLQACAQRALGKMRFPATGAPTLVTLPINLG